MIQHRSLFVGLALCGAFVLAPLAHAQLQVCHTNAIPLTTTNWSQTVSVPRFDPALGILQSIDFELTGTIDGTAKVESLDNGPSNVSLSFQGQLVLTRPDASQLVVVLPVANFNPTFGAFDGVVDFAGASGITYPAVQATSTNSTTSPLPLSDLALFTGPANNAGSITLPVHAAGTSVATGAGNIISQFTQRASANVKVCYHYLPDCNHNGLADSADIANGAADGDNDGIPDECQPGTTSVCEGDGTTNGGANCPCSNNAPVGAHGGCINQVGLYGILAATGVPSVSNDTLTLTASGMHTGAGFFFQGTALVNAGAGQGFGNGLRCVGGTVLRINKIPTNQAGGVLPYPNGPSISALLGCNAGETRVYQVWYRDALNSCGQPFNTTNAIRVIWGL